MITICKVKRIALEFNILEKLQEILNIGSWAEFQQYDGVSMNYTGDRKEDTRAADDLFH